MSLINIRAALEAKLNGMANPISYAWENRPFTPVVDIPYAAVFLLPAAPDNPTMGDDYYREIGIFQVSLFYPIKAGAGVAAARAQLIRAAFKRGTSMTSGAVTVRVSRTPEISQGRVDGDRWMVPVRIVWWAGINP